jgi:hypothetical protein
MICSEAGGLKVEVEVEVEVKVKVRTQGTPRAVISITMLVMRFVLGDIPARRGGNPKGGKAGRREGGKARRTTWQAWQAWQISTLMLSFGNVIECLGMGY